MKLTLLLMCLTALQISASVYSQNTKIALKSTQGKFGEIITAIEEQTDYKVFYKNEQIDLNRRIQLGVSTASIAELLNQALEGTNLVYTLLDKIIVLSPKEGAMAQQLTIKGKVLDETGQGMPGVNVVEKGTTNGGVTDLDGIFSINVSSTESVLVFSFVGYTSTEVTVGTQTNITITLSPDLMKLDEIVVVGYGVQKKKLVTGATINVKGENLQKLSTTNALQALQGQTPGVNITSISGQPGEGIKVIIRGVGTIGNSGPLYLVDGVATGDISYLNNADIESIDILKDAASAAIYGSRAANGVVLITTKQGKAGKTMVTFDGYTGVQNVARKSRLLNAQEYATIMNEQSVNSGGLPYFSNQEIEAMPDLAAVGLMGDNDWVDEMFVSNARIQNYTLGIQGGNDNSIYSMAASYTQQAGIVGGQNWSNYERYGLRLNSEHQVKKYLKVGQHLTFAYINRNGIQVGNQYSNTLRGAYNANPFIKMYDPESTNPGGFADNSSATWTGGTQSNPYAEMVYNNQNKRNNQKLFGDVYFELTPIKNLTLKTSVGFDYYADENRSFKPYYKLSIYSSTDSMKVNQSMGRGFAYTWDNLVTYKLSLNDHQMDFMAGMSAYQNKSTGINGENQHLAFDDIKYAYLSNALNSSNAQLMSIGGSPFEESLLSYFGRVTYNFKEKYLFNATFRADGSSKFAKENRWGYFPSVSAGWVVTNEPFSEQIKEYINYLKLKTSWGRNGNQSVDPFQYISPINLSNTYYTFGIVEGMQIPGAYPSRIPNPKLKWETSEQINIGFDAGFLNGKLNANFDWYKKTTKDWLLRAPILATAGADAPFINGGNVENKGVEIALNYQDKIGKLNYSVGVNMANNKNKVINVPTDDGTIHGSSNLLWNNSPEFYRAQTNMPIGYFWGYKTLGVFQDEAEVQAYRNEEGGLIQPNAKPGDLIFADVFADGEITAMDKTMIGDPNPDYTFGFNVALDYNGFDFSMVAYGVAGNQLVQSYRNQADQYANYPISILNRWHGKGSSNKLPRLTTDAKNYVEFSDIYIQDGDFLRISNVTLGYDFTKVLKFKNINQLRLYFTAQNLLTLTKYDGMDPEIGYGNNGAVDDRYSSGIDLGYYPRPRTFLVGLNIKF